MIQSQINEPAYPDWPSDLGKPSFPKISPFIGKADALAQFKSQQYSTNLSSLLTKKYSTKSVVGCQNGIATIKCYNCVKFDPYRLGFYCNTCFAARHPSYRLPHSYISIVDAGDDNELWQSHVQFFNQEQDIEELKLLLHQTSHAINSNHINSRTSLMSVKRPSLLIPFIMSDGEVDFHCVKAKLAGLTQSLDQLKCTMARKGPLTKSIAYGRFKKLIKLYKDKKQFGQTMVGPHEQANLNEPTPELSSTKTNSHGNFPINNSSQSTNQEKQFVKDNESLKNIQDIELCAAKYLQRVIRNWLHSKTLQPQEGHVRLPLLSVESIYSSNCKKAEFHTQYTEAAIKIQNFFHKYKIRQSFNALTASLHDKNLDSETTQYHNLNFLTNQLNLVLNIQSLVQKDDISILHTQSMHDAKCIQYTSDTANSSSCEENAAHVIQRLLIKYSGILMILRRCDEIYQQLYDEQYDAYYYYNINTSESSWDVPLFYQKYEVLISYFKNNKRYIH